MDADSWSSRLSSASRSYKSALQSRSGGTKWDGFDAEMLMGFEEIDVADDDIREEYPCPFCTDYFDIVGLCCHIDDEHPVEAKNGRKRKLRKGSSHSTLSLLRRELRDGNLQSLFGGSSCIVSSSSAAPDPLLSSFILPMAEDYGTSQSHSSAATAAVKKSTSEIAAERKAQTPPLSIKDQEEKTKRSQFVQGLLLSTIFDVDL
ncbi:OLC1v1001973C3 [Oldenlandia corymbosa var. corymbosa]|uniref:OLC1v1001973C3 n=1 Tax=Oldenlandia corymbosa var. corymbosa TaxID=529605 RepID=A0AAV1D6J2_OLDCO|nr:OLC1v1001973C3 [Oldenlandia corymbosa var. corymbosa]